MDRDRAILALYEASAALQRAKEHVTDPILLARIREVAHDVLVVTGKVCTQRPDVEVIS